MVRRLYVLPATMAVAAMMAVNANAQTQYDPSTLSNTREVTDTLANTDIPAGGAGGFFRDYTVALESGDQVAIDVVSEEFDTLVSLLDKNGATIGENDDGPDGTTNSLLFTRISEPGTYTVRVQSYAGQGMGEFYLKVARLREVR